MNIKYLISFLLLIGIAANGCGPLMALAHTAEAAEADLVTISDLGIENPGLLPTNPFYFLKEWGRGVRRVFTFNSVQKAELELRITNEKAAEVKQVEETAPENTEAITEAVKNYEGAQARLQTRLESLKETSQNPNVDRLLNELADRTVKHQKLFDELAKKFETSGEIKTAVETAKNKLGEATAAGAGKDDPGKFAAKLENALVASRGGELKHLQSVEIIDQIQKKAPEQVRDSLERLRKNFSERLDEDIKKALEKEGSDKVEKAIRDLPGDAGRRSVILDEIKAAAERRVREVLDAASEKLEASTRQEKNIAEKAKEQLQRAEEAIQKLESAIKESGSAPGVVSRLLEQARGNFKEALLAFEEGKFGEAFGQARSGEVLARNGLRFLEEERPQADDLKEELNELQAKIERYEQFLKEKGYSPEKNPKAYSLLEEARKHLGFAEEALVKNDREGTKLHIGHVLGYLRDLSRIIEEENRRSSESTIKLTRPVLVAPAPAVKPVPRCEEIKRNLDQLWEMFKAGRINEQDYNLKYEVLKKEQVNCEASVSPQPAPTPMPIPAPMPKTSFRNAYWQCYDGKEFRAQDASSCKSSGEWQEEAKRFCEGRCYDDKSKCGVNTFSISNECGLNTETQILCTQEYNPVCGADSKTYSNECSARVAGAVIKYKGECSVEEKSTATEPTTAPAVKPEPTAAPAPATTFTAVDSFFDVFVTIDENSQFSPSAVKVKKGGKVTWTNKSSRAVWPASAFHPTHTLYPGFDALRGLKTGETYSFVFEKVGSWKYHDHLNSGVTGVVEVVE